MANGPRTVSDLLSIPEIAEQAFANLPVWLWDVETGRIVFANAAGVRFFGEATLAALLTHRFDMDRPAMRQLRGVAASLPEDGRPRLAMLRFFVALRDVAVACACRRLEMEGNTLVLLSAVGGHKDASPLAERAAILFDAEERPVVVAHAGEIVYRNRAAAGTETVAGGQTVELPFGGETAEVVLDAPREAAGETAEEIEETAEKAPAEPLAAPEAIASSPQRFSFVLDAEGRFVDVGPALAATVGPRSGDVSGRFWADVAADLGVDPEGAVAAALLRQDTWSGITLDWPADAGGYATVRLAALPRFGDGRVFVGYRGFGDVMEVTAPPAEEPQAEAEAGIEPQAEAELEPAPEAEPSRDNVHTLPRPLLPEAATGTRLNDRERTAFEQIAHALGARMPGEPAESERPAAETPAEEVSEPIGEDEEPPEEIAAADERLADEACPVAEEPAGAAAEEPAGAERPVEEQPFEEPEAAGEFSPYPAHDRRTLALVAETAVTDALDRLPLGVAVTRNDEVLYANRAFLELFDFADVDDLEVAGGLSTVFQGRSANEGTGVAAQRRDGTPVVVESRLGRLPWPGGPAMFVTAWETPARPTAAADGDVAPARDEVAELRAILDTATDGVLVLAGDGTVESVNGSAEAVFGYASAEMVGRPFADLVAEESRVAVEDYLDGLASGGVVSVLNDGREILARARGGEVPLFLTIGRLGEAQPPRFCAVIRDLTDWKGAEAELVEARKRAEAASAQKSDFLAKMSHEIRTPLNAIIGFAEVILEERLGAMGTDRYRDYVKDIRASGEHIMSLVNDLLDLSKIEAGKLDLTFTGVNLNDIVEQSVAIMQPQANRERVIIRTSLARSTPPVVADVRSLRQVMLNLLSNAIKFTPPGGQVIVSTVLADSGEVMLRVRDTGVGMSEADIQMAMEPFRQLAVRSSSRQQGTGLGLPLTRALVEANRATFAIRSKVNEGTLVEVAFPQSRVLAE